MAFGLTVAVATILMGAALKAGSLWGGLLDGLSLLCWAAALWQALSLRK